MFSILEKFDIINAKSSSFTLYSKGNIPFVTNGSDLESSVIGYVKPLQGDRIFYENSISLSSFGEAIIPPVPFIARGNGGSGLIILAPKNDMSIDELYFYASQINMQKWRFSFSFMAIKKRVEKINLIEFSPLKKIAIEKRIKELTPKKRRKNKKNIISELRLINVIYDKKTKEGLCTVSKSTALPQNALEKGETPYITTSSLNNGVSGFYDIQPNFKSKCLTLALNGSVGEVFFQFEDFVTSGDNAVLTLKDGYNPYLLFYIATMIRNHKWRYNYYRKLNLTKLNKMQIPVPFKNNNIDIEYIEKIVKNSYGYKEIAKFL